MTTPALDAGLFPDLLKASSATICTQLFRRGFRNTYLQGVRPLNPACTPIIGEAFTLRYIPAREDLDVVESFEDVDHPQRLAIESVEPGQVLVMDCRQDGRAAAGGHILLTRLLRRGAAGVVTDGSLRDSPSIAQMGFPAFSAGVSPQINLTLHHAVDMQVPIGCGGVAIYPGDIILADAEGVVCIPRHVAAEIAAPAAEQERMEGYLQAKIDAGANLIGTYPPNDETLQEYADWVARDGASERDGGEARAAMTSSNTAISDGRG